MRFLQESTTLLNWMRGFCAAVFIGLNTAAACVPLYAMALLRLVLPAGGKRWVSGKMDGIIDYWVGSNRHLLRLAAICTVDVQGLEAAALSRDEWYLVIANHQSWTDILILQTCLRQAVPPLKFFTKQQLIWLPFLGLAMYLLGFPYVRRISQAQLAKNPELKGSDQRSTLQACEGFKTKPTAILNFLEGTRFTPEKHQAQIAARKASAGLADDPSGPIFYNKLLMPKVGGMQYVLQGMGETLDGILDATILYPTATPPTFWDFLCGRCPTATLRVVRHPLPLTSDGKAIHKDRDALAAWVHKIWQDKDERLQNTVQEPS